MEYADMIDRIGIITISAEMFQKDIEAVGFVMRDIIPIEVTIENGDITYKCLSKKFEKAKLWYSPPRYYVIVTDNQDPLNHAYHVEFVKA